MKNRAFNQNDPGSIQLSGDCRAFRLSTRTVAFLLNSLATIQCVWFYLARVPPALSREAYESGMERTPFQHRVLMMAPMQWAHSSVFLVRLAAKLSSMTGWLPRQIGPEGIVEAVIDILSVVIAGQVTVKLYRTASISAGRKAVLAPFVYPLTLVMIWATYSGMVSHSLRFIYDLPSLAFFSSGLYILFHKRHPLWFCALFIIGTLNRETTLLLLPLFLLAKSAGGQSLDGQIGRNDDSRRPHFAWVSMFTKPSMLVTGSLLLFWIVWRAWISQHFSHNPSAAGPRLWLNLGTIVCPLAWPQLALGLAGLAPIVWLERHSIPDALLRKWLYMLPVWAAFMLWYGLFIEARIFGELIPLVAVCAALVAETHVLEMLDGEGPASSVAAAGPN